MTEEKEYTLQEAKNMLLQLAGCGIKFLPVNAWGPPEQCWPYKEVGADWFHLGFRSQPLVHPKFDSPKDFWIAFEKPTFDQSYVWTKET